MNRIFLSFFLLSAYFISPDISFAQTAQKANAKQKTKPLATTEVKAATTTDTPAASGFTINGTVTGFPEGTAVDFLNGMTGTTEMSTQLKEGKFSFKGKMEQPDFKIVLFNKQPPFITLFLDNSNVTITGNKEAIDKATVTGSVSHTAFSKFNTSLEPYQAVFNPNLEYDSALTAKATKLIMDFVSNNTNSAIAPLAIIRYNQAADDILKTEELYNLLPPNIQNSGLGQIVAQQIAEGKVNGPGTMLADFSQPDTAGVPVSLSSLRGKYVLIDFWASWCGPCRQENPNLLAAYNKFKSKNFTVLGVSLDKTKPAWLDAIKADGLNWTHVSDLQGWNNSVAQQFGIFQIPQNILVDPQGKVVGKNLRGPALDRKLSRVLK